MRSQTIISVRQDPYKRHLMRGTEVVGIAYKTFEGTWRLHDAEDKPLSRITYRSIKETVDALKAQKPDLLQTPAIKERVANRQRQNQEIGFRLTQARAKAGYDTSSKAAHAAGVTINTFWRHENGERTITERHLELYAATFNVSTQWLLHGDQN